MAKKVTLPIGAKPQRIRKAKKFVVAPHPIETSVPERKLALRVIANEAVFKEGEFEFDDSFKAGDPSKFRSVHTIPELMACLQKDKTVQAEGIFLEADTKGNYRYRRINGAEKIKEVWQKNKRLTKFREADNFASDNFPGSSGANAGLVGDDFVPLLGGPFNKQPYLYDYLRAHAYCFNEYHHHPFARAIVHITRDFVLGRGYRVDSDDPRALALWRAFEKVNNLEKLMEQIVLEGSIYGENMIWWLPNQETYIAYQDRPGQEPQQGIIPRIRLIDPSTCWEIVTYPEDITRVLYYQLVFPTQYQIYTGRDAGQPVPSSKFVMQQLPADDVMHFKYNSVSNEKRGRSDLFPVLGYLKWVKDCVSYKLISLKKQSAWTEDISVEGSQTDVDNLAGALKSMGTYEPAGSRFIHTSKIERKYLANQGTGGTSDDMTLTHGVDMIAVGTQIPVSYFGMSKSAGQNKASAIVGTEPFAKKIQRRQNDAAGIVQSLWTKFQDTWGVKGAECKITFPEIISQDSSAKLKDIKFAEDCGYISKETAAPMAAEELDIDDYDWKTESQKIAAEEPGPLTPVIVSPLTAPASGNSPTNSSGSHPLLSQGDTSQPKPQSNGGLSQNDRASYSNKDH